MLFSLLATFLVGAAVGVMIWAGFRTVKRKAPGYLIPMAVGASMLGYTIYAEYSWFSRMTSEFPPRVEVVKTYTETKPWAPWTYVVPRIGRFLAVDLRTARRNPVLPGHVIVETLLVKRDDGPASLWQMIDCDGGRFTALPADPRFGADGLPEGASWLPRADLPELFAAVCSG